MSEEPVLIVGMHRSGTSATAGLLSRLGFYLGTVDQIQPADAHNQDGYYELRPAVALNDRILEALGASWDVPPQLGSGLLAHQSEMQSSIRDLTARLGEEARRVNRPWAIKDPRLSLLWKLWLDSSPTARTVICVRDPASVASSLAQRNGVSVLFGLRLCERYFEHLLEIPKCRVAITVRYEDLVTDPVSTARTIADALGLNLVESQIQAAAAGVKREFWRNKSRVTSISREVAIRRVDELYRRLTGGREDRELGPEKVCDNAERSAESAAVPAVASSGIISDSMKETSMKAVTNPLLYSPRRINHLLRKQREKRYLEIGVWEGATFFDVDAIMKVAVDPAFQFSTSEFESGTVHFHQCTSDEFFIRYAGRQKFDLIFIDGLHTFEQTFRDFCSSLAHSHDSTVWILDDVLPNDVFSSLPEWKDAMKFRKAAGLTGNAWHGDTYKVVLALHDFFPSLSYCTISTGGNAQTLVWKKPRSDFKPHYNSMEKISRVSYFDLQTDIAILKLLPEDEALAKVQADLELG